MLMSTSRSIQVSITHTVLGVAIGGIIEALLPKFSADADVPTQVFEALVQVGLNGAALASVGAYISQNDPTFGMPFSMALFSAQPELTQRIESLSAVVKAQVAQAAQKTAPQRPMV